MDPRSAFNNIARWTSRAMGSPVAFLIAILVVLVWAVTGPLFGFSDTWQLVINTGTTIVTFLMVFLIQNSQNRDSAALHVKLDELIRATEGAHNRLISMEESTEDELDEVRSKYEEIAEKAPQVGADTGTPTIALSDEQVEEVADTVAQTAAKRIVEQTQGGESENGQARNAAAEAAAADEGRETERQKERSSRR